MSLLKHVVETCMMRGYLNNDIWMILTLDYNILTFFWWKFSSTCSIFLGFLHRNTAAGCSHPTETLFALSLATHRHATPASVSLNVTSHLWLRPVLFIAEQLKCEGSQWEDKYKRQQAEGLSQTKARIFTASSLNTPPETSTVRTRFNTPVHRLTSWFFFLLPLNILNTFAKNNAMFLVSDIFVRKHKRLSIHGCYVAVLPLKQNSANELV